MSVELSQYTNVSLLLTTVVPLLIGILCYAINQKTVRKALVVAGTFSAMAGGVLLFLILRQTDGNKLFLNPEALAIAGMHISWFELIAILDIVLMIGFLAITIIIRSWVGLLFTVAQLVPLAWYEFSFHPAQTDKPLFIDYWSGIMCLIISIIGSLIVLYALTYMDGHYKKRNRFFAYMVGFLGAMNAAVFCNELLWFFFFWEITTLASYMLIKHEEDETSMKNAKWALELNLGGGVAMALAIVYLGWKENITTFSELLEMNTYAAVVIIGIALVCFAALVKSAQIPFQSWLLGAMVAPTPVSALLHSSTMVKLGVYLIVRVSPVFEHVAELGYILAIIGAFSFVMTAVLAFAQPNAKKVLAYSTIGNLGLIIMLAGINTPLAISAAIILTIFHAISKAMLFLGVGVVQHETHKKDIENMEGLINRRPFIAMIILGGIMTMIIPPFGVFLGKYLALQSAVAFPWVIIFLAIGSAATVAYYTKWLGRILSSDTQEDTKREAMPSLFSVPLMVLLTSAVALSILIVPFTQKIINPTVLAMDFHTVLDTTSILGIGTPVGFFSSLLIAIFLGVILLVPWTMAVDRKKLTTPYAAGLDYPTKLKGSYLDDYVGEKKLNAYVNAVGIVFIFDLLVLGFIFILAGGA